MGLDPRRRRGWWGERRVQPLLLGAFPGASRPLPWPLAPLLCLTLDIPGLWAAAFSPCGKSGMVCTPRQELRRRGGEMVKDGTPNPEIGVAPWTQVLDREVSLA